jgi:hypothetical protein
MVLARRDSQGKAVAQFWRWWPGVRGRVEAAIATGQWGELTPEVSARVAAIHPDLQWEFARGTKAKHALVVCAAGDHRLRAAAARWRAAAPPVDDQWEYHAARQPEPANFTAILDLGGQRIALQDLRFAYLLDANRCQIDVVCHHPVFAETPEQVRQQITFLALDWLLGEEAVELWVGGVAWETVRPHDAQPPRELGAAVAELAARYEKPVWAVLSGHDADGYPILATVQQPLKPARWPRFDTHLAVTLPYEKDNVGLPTDTALQALRAFEDELATVLGADGALVAHESNRGQRTLHVYADGESSVPAAVRRAASGRATIQSKRDPSFTGIDHLRP